LGATRPQPAQSNNSETQAAVFQESLIALPFSIFRRGISREQQYDEVQGTADFVWEQIKKKNPPACS
jgi:hypothetical protein